ncbi:MAG: acyl-ACP thioesterase domain-containing protein [Candidatus Limnocylindrus sp.]
MSEALMDQIAERLTPGLANDEVRLPTEARFREEGRGVRFDECDSRGRMRAAALLRHAQDLAWRHSEVLEYGRAWYEARGVGWVVRSVDLLIDQPPQSNENLSGTTALVGFRHVMARRHTRLFGPTGRVVADAAIDWVMTDQDGRPVRFPQEFERFVQQVNATFVPNKIPVAAPSGAGIEIAIRRADIDPLGHVNHAAWLEIIEEAVAQVAPTHLEAPRRRIRMEYLAVTADRTARVHILGDAGDDQLRVDVTDTIGSPILRAELSVIGS